MCCGFVYCLLLDMYSRHRMTEQEEDEELLNESSTEEGPVVARFAESPSCKLLYLSMYSFYADCY